MKFKRVKLGELCQVKGGKRLPKGIELVDFSNHPYIRIRDMYQNKYLHLNNEFMYVDDITFEKISKYIVNSEDVIIANVGNTIGLVSLIGDDLDNANLTENCVKLVNLKNIDNNYLFYYLRSSLGQSEIKKGIVGSSQPKLPIYNIEKFDVLLPEIAEQKKISKILSSIDSKIDLNNQINNNLLEQGKTFYINYINENLNLIEKKLGEFFPIITGKKDANASVACGKYPFFTCSQNICRIDEYSFDDDAILLAGNGDFNVKFYRGKFDAYQRTYVLIPYKKINLGYLYFSILCNLDEITSTQRGSVIKFITKSSIEDYAIKEINDNKIKEYFNTIIKKIEFNNKQNEILERLRDTLLPKLMNGEIDLDNIEI